MLTAIDVAQTGSYLDVESNVLPDEVAADRFPNDRPIEKRQPKRAEGGTGLSALLEDPSIALWATEIAARYRVSPMHVLRLLAEALEKGRKR
jgi:hypothetical protein